MSNVKKGNDYRDHIAKLLRAAQYRNVEVEKRVNFKKVDIYYEDVVFGERIRVAVEAKNYERPLTKDYISTKIAPEYKTLIDNNELDRVFIIAPLDISPDARSYARSSKLTFMTLVQFQAQIMDFSHYLEGLCSSYLDSGLNSYYMKPLFNEGKNLENYLDSWLDETNAQPIAILAGYGMGKTSFSKYYASELAKKFIEDNTRRIPVALKLGDISSEQSLEGLLAKSLTTQCGVVRFNFELFMDLNRSGQFCVILDGFDEMKHTMSWDQFMHNIKQLNRLIKEDSKVLLLGRPSAFLSDSEHQMVLNGVRKVDEKSIRMYEWSNYEKIELDLFSYERAIEFIEKYISHIIDSNDIDCKKPKDVFIQDRLREIQELDFSEIILRPVQAKMLAEIASHPDEKLESYSRYGLFKHFIDLIIERELEKSSREKFSSEIRRSFIRDVAWWMWESSRSSGFSSEEVPHDLISKYHSDRSVAVKAVLRDLISGSVLETKGADKFYFPHRSYHEFLVSEYINSSPTNLSDLPKVSSAVNLEISNFLKESNSTSHLMRIRDQLPEYHGSLNIIFLQLLAWAERKHYANKLNLEKTLHPWHVVTKYLGLVGRTPDAQHIDEASHYIIKNVNSGIVNESKLVSLVCMFLSISWASESVTKNLLTSYLTGAILVSALPELENSISRSKKIKRIAIPSGLDSPFMRLVLAGFDHRIESDGAFQITISASKIFKELTALLSPRLKILGLDAMDFESRNMPLITLSALFDELSLSKRGGVVIKYFREFHSLDKFVPVSNKATNRGNNLPDWVRPNN